MVRKCVAGLTASVDCGDRLSSMERRERKRWERDSIRTETQERVADASYRVYGGEVWAGWILDGVRVSALYGIQAGRACALRRRHGSM